MNWTTEFPLMVSCFPNAPRMDYLPTLGEKWLHSRGNVGKYSLHGASGFGISPVPNILRLPGPGHIPNERVAEMPAKWPVEINGFKTSDTGSSVQHNMLKRKTCLYDHDMNHEILSLKKTQTTYNMRSYSSHNIKKGVARYPLFTKR